MNPKGNREIGKIGDSESEEEEEQRVEKKAAQNIHPSDAAYMGR